ncbi:hypothetical protein A3J90_03165 [candidate division WOR-1 bacterium RIFOXYC2_FULL_37_10]|uniref:Uncharacterized protein n=1 Tax=candidate division WOR-1 bacterium RIFOXYB2_FULL_37_13 TaxID=1802579 RepID=A0A1F4SDZ1_UNCSA|nr:MAG: hypothetical protein A2310_03535 [candidate division WOR-1 bacterium RIFOXYB2_FULL_37_13]OGC36832.1 MAG: hypothetical protein A3J90_03165 [candidate division WOR-1 bacterium RIFOXYC2_FULL_37_10]
MIVKINPFVLSNIYEKIEPATPAIRRILNSTLTEMRDTKRPLASTWERSWYKDWAGNPAIDNIVGPKWTEGRDYYIRFLECFNIEACRNGLVEVSLRFACRGAGDFEGVDHGKRVGNIEISRYPVEQVKKMLDRLFKELNFGQLNLNVNINILDGDKPFDFAKFAVSIKREVPVLQFDI